MDTVFDFDENMRMRQVRGTELRWYDAKDARFGLFGSDALSEDGFCRMTQAERAHLLPVNEGEAWLGEHSAGIGLQFETDSAQLFVRVKNRSGFDMTNMTLIGQTGIDLYVYDESLSRYRLHEVARGNFEDSEYEFSLGHFSDRPRRKRKYLMYLPLYMSTLRLEIGLDKESEIIPVPFENQERICVYGTSITQGCSASRPGMAYTNILSRRLCCEVLNFGFSGSAFMEKEMGEILGKRKLDLLIVDAEPNAGCDERMKDNAEKFLNAFFDGMIYINSPEKMPLQTYIQQLTAVIRDDIALSEEEMEQISKISGSTFNAAKVFVTMIPILIVYPFLQRYFVTGLVVGSVKG